MATDTRQQLGYFIDAAVERLDGPDLRLTAITKHSWEGVDKKLIDRVLWELEELTPREVAEMFSLDLTLVLRVSQLAGANGRIPAGP